MIVLVSHRESGTHFRDFIQVQRDFLFLPFSLLIAIGSAQVKAMEGLSFMALVGPNRYLDGSEADIVNGFLFLVCIPMVENLS